MVQNMTEVLHGWFSLNFEAIDWTEIVLSVRLNWIEFNWERNLTITRRPHKSQTSYNLYQDVWQFKSKLSEICTELPKGRGLGPKFQISTNVFQIWSQILQGVVRFRPLAKPKLFSHFSWPDLNLATMKEILLSQEDHTNHKNLIININHRFS